MLTSSNYKKGFLLADDWMAGVAEDPETKGQFVAYVLSQSTGDYLGAHRFESLEAAIASLRAIPKEWQYQAIQSCSGQCKTGGNCGGKCGPKAALKGNSPT